MHLNFNPSSFIRTLRLVFAAIIGLIIAYLSKLPHSVWIVISIVVVLFDQSTVGGTIQKGIFRTIATIVSAAISIMTIYLFKNNHLINEIVFILCLSLYAYYFMNTKKSYIGVIGCVTLAIILLNDVVNTNAAILRSITIIIGVLLATATMIFFRPQYAAQNKNQLLIHLLAQLENTLSNFMNKNITLEDLHEDFLDYESNYLQQLNSITRLIDESKFEIKIFNKTPLNHAQYQNTVLHFRRISRLVGVLIHHLPDSELRFNQDLTPIIDGIIMKIKYIKSFLMQKNAPQNSAALEEKEEHQVEVSDHSLLFALHTTKYISNEIDLILATIITAEPIKRH